MYVQVKITTCGKISRDNKNLVFIVIMIYFVCEMHFKIYYNTVTDKE